MLAEVTDQATSSYTQPSSDLAAALLHRGYDCAESESGELFVRRGTERWKSTYWDDHANLWIEDRYRTSGAPVPRLLVDWATLEAECPKLPKLDVDRDPSETQIREEKSRTFEIISDFCEKLGATPVEPTPDFLARMPTEVAEAWRQHIALEDRSGRDSALYWRTTTRRPSTQRMIRRAPERRSINAAKRHASGTRRRSASSTSSSGDDPPLPGAAREVARGIPPHGVAPLSKLELALEVLRHELADGPRRTVDVNEAALRAGVSISTVKRARKALGVKRHRIRFGPGGEFHMSLPLVVRDDLVTIVGDYVVRTPSRWGEGEEDQAAHHLERVGVARAAQDMANIGRLAVAS